MSLTIHSTAHLLTNEELLRGNRPKRLFNIAVESTPKPNPNIALVMQQIDFMSKCQNLKEFEDFALYVSGYLKAALDMSAITQAEHADLRATKHAIQDAISEKFKPTEGRKS